MLLTITFNTNKLTFNINTLSKEIEKGLSDLRVDINIRLEMGLAWFPFTIILQNHSLFSDFKRVGIFDKEISKLFDMLTRYMSDFRACLTSMTQQRLDWYFRILSILNELLSKVFHSFRCVVSLVHCRIFRVIAFGYFLSWLISIHVNIVTIYQK